MANAIGKYAAKKLLRKQMDRYKTKEVGGDKDPYFAMVKNPRNGKMKKVKKQIPDYIPEHDAKILAKMRSRAYKLDMCLFNFMGIRFGWSSVIGLIPAFGDVIDALLAFLLFLRCRKVECGLGNGLELYMMINIIVDFGIGLVPFIGDLGDAAFKANTRNLRLLEERLDKVYKPKAQQQAEASMRPEDRPQPATVYEDFSDEDNDMKGPPPAYDGSGGVRVPQPARVRSERERRDEPPAPKRSGTGGRGWLNGGSKRERERDVEMGEVDAPARSGTRGSRR
ncbi:hypothetical protein K432DRAFT_380285 [Lepidopterella palustris CBS 459.81]|uniref:PH domain-containing protein n=1 Tax=Lepidopterella palustris CBS 459.81 TaxID=1314670 RepID=A0A8E2EEM4_9PEZI|nr:hypothetical protein K432DRAFT_380285 [Lepidopterella palustris CBS 459.81]